MNEAPLKAALVEYVQLRSGRLVGLLAGMFFGPELQHAHDQIGGIAGFRRIERSIAERLQRQDLSVDDVLEFREGLVSFSDELAVRSVWLSRSSYLLAIVLGLLGSAMGWTAPIVLVYMLGILFVCLYLLYTAVRIDQQVASYQRFIEVLDGIASDKQRSLAEPIVLG